jgi:hypothetical protein
VPSGWRARPALSGSHAAGNPAEIVDADRTALQVVTGVAVLGLAVVLGSFFTPRPEPQPAQAEGG